MFFVDDFVDWQSGHGSAGCCSWPLLGRLTHLQSIARLAGGGWFRVAFAGMTSLCPPGPPSFCGRTQAPSQSSWAGLQGEGRSAQDSWRLGSEVAQGHCHHLLLTKASPQSSPNPEWKRGLHLVTGGAAEPHGRAWALREGIMWIPAVSLSPELFRLSGCSTITTLSERLGYTPPGRHRN